MSIRTVFLLGVPKNRTALPLWDQLLSYESQTYKDVLLWDFEDTFFNLTLKETHFLNWINSSCPRVKSVSINRADLSLFSGAQLTFISSYPGSSSKVMLMCMLMWKTYWKCYEANSQTRICLSVILLSVLNPFAGALPNTMCQSFCTEGVCTPIMLAEEGSLCRDTQLRD